MPCPDPIYETSPTSNMEFHDRRNSSKPIRIPMQRLCAGTNLKNCHLRGLLRDDILHYHEDRIRNAQERETPRERLFKRREANHDTLNDITPVGGLHLLWAMSP